MRRPRKRPSKVHAGRPAYKPQDSLVAAQPFKTNPKVKQRNAKHAHLKNSRWVDIIAVASPHSWHDKPITRARFTDKDSPDEQRRLAYYMATKA